MSRSPSWLRAWLGAGAEGSPELLAALERLSHLIDWERRERAPAGRLAMKVSVDPARDLLRLLGSPEQHFRVVHVTGTKGKGSVCALIAAGLQKAGLRVGRYASPHVERIHERIFLDGAPIEDAPFARALEEALEALDAARSKGSPAAEATWFDVLTATACRAFRLAGLEWAVVEAGLGGRLDSTNALDGEVALVTCVELEHTAILGDTREAIAAEKAGIFKAGAVAISGLAPEDPAGRVVAERARELGCELRLALAAEPSFEAKNRALAGAALDALGGRGVSSGEGVPVGAELLEGPLPASAQLPGRLERLDCGGTPVVLDGAHVAASVEALLEELSSREGFSRPPVVVLGLARDKDPGGILKVVAGRVERLVCTAGQGLFHRPEDLVLAARSEGIPAETAEGPAAAFERARFQADGRTWVLVTGSLHLIGDVRPVAKALSEGTRC